MKNTNYSFDNYSSYIVRVFDEPRTEEEMLGLINRSDIKIRSIQTMFEKQEKFYWPNDYLKQCQPDFYNKYKLLFEK